MSQPKIYLNSRDWDRAHQEKRIAKLQKIQGLRALLEMWEECIETDADHQYVLMLRAKLRSAENQYRAMKV